MSSIEFVCCFGLVLTFGVSLWLAFGRGKAQGELDVRAAGELVLLARLGGMDGRVRGAAAQLKELRDSVSSQLKELREAVGAKPAAILRVAEVLQRLEELLHRIEVRENGGGPLSLSPAVLLAEQERVETPTVDGVEQAVQEVLRGLAPPSSEAPEPTADDDQVLTRRSARSDLEAALGASGREAD